MPVKINEFVMMQSKHVNKNTVIFSEKTREWCKLPYPGHPRGCPNYGKNEKCPPRSKIRTDILERHESFILAYATFDVTGYVTRMKLVHPDWSDRQLRNSRYWQGSLKKMLLDFIRTNFDYKEILGAGSGFMNSQSMESAGIDVFATLNRNGITFDRTARKFIIMVSLLIPSNRKRLW